MNKEHNTPASPKINIQGVTKDKIKLSVNGETKEILNKLDVLKELLQDANTKTFQTADKIYNINSINEANFGIVTSNRLFNAVLCSALIRILPDADQAYFKCKIPREDMEDWPCKRNHLKAAQELLATKFIWVIGYEIRRLFAIGNDKNKRLENKIEEYIDHCFKTYRFSLQLFIYMFLSKLWDEKIKSPDIKIDAELIKVFFNTKRVLKLKELRLIAQSLIRNFNENKLELPLDKTDLGDLNIYLEPDSTFNKACTSLEVLEDMEQHNSTYDLGHCHTAEIALAEILAAFKFFATHDLYTMRKIEYEQIRNNPPFYVKNINILKRKNSKHDEELQRRLKYDTKPAVTYSILIRNERNVVNLFPFVLDYNALINEKNFEIYFYENRHEQNGLNYFSIKKEEHDKLYFRATERDFTESESEEAALEKQKAIRVDQAIKQFENALNIILGKDFHFEPKNNKKQSKLDNI